jgi:formylglycine-generating enzyme required for sulfatase activity/disulfide oxidoreductase YuzD
MLLWVCTLTSFASPEKILPKTLVLKPAAYYAEQADFWATEVSQSQERADAWFNLYAASSYAQASPARLRQIIDDMTRTVPQSYEWLVAKGWNEGYQRSAVEYLNKAYTLQPGNPEAYALLQVTAELDLNLNQRQEFSKLLFNSDRVSSSLLNYSYNVLMSVEPSAILITEGESTTIPLFVLQDVFGLRKDVSILNLDLLTNTEYLTRKLNTLGLSLSAPLSAAQIRSALCTLLPHENQERKFYYALTVSKDNLSTMKESLYVVGLASLHSVTNVDNVAQIRKHMEKEFLLDYLRVDFNGESPDATGKVLSSNYLVPMILLYESYVKEGNTTKAGELRHLMERVARDSGKESAVADFLGEETELSIPYFPFGMDIKKVDGRFRYFTKTLYGEESEITNDQYNAFLNYLKVNNLTDLLGKFDFDFSAYQEPTLSMMKNYTANRVQARRGKALNSFVNYPAVNISYDAALAYCAWLTDQYNHADGRKFKKVRFRLPSIEEWQLAAASIKDPLTMNWDDQFAEAKVAPAGGNWIKDAKPTKVSLHDPSIQYPWFRWWTLRNSAVNNKGCYLGNFKVPDNGACPGIKKYGFLASDGFSSMSPTESYFPNDIGLYDVVGNVAEMTIERGKACGGSWNHSPEESTMRSVSKYDKPEAWIGFRVFMEIIEK